jgi:hypothetical protein
MGYVADDDIFSGDEDLSASSMSNFMDGDSDDDDVDQEILDGMILADAKTVEPRALQGDAASFEAPLNAGIHAWSGIKKALEHTFDGWPDSAEYENFRKIVRVALAKEKQFMPRRDPETVGIELSCIPAIDNPYKKFTAFPENPLGKHGRKLNYYKNVLKIMANGVKYLTADMRIKYEVTLGAQLTRRGYPFCTEALCNRKLKNSIPGSQHSSKLVGKKKRCMWVMTESGDGDVRCYSHFGKIGAFHHSSFLGGGGVMAAGEWYVEKGKCTLVNALSGHYKPEPWRLLRALKVLASRGVISAETEIQVFTATYPAGAEARLNLIDFMNNWAKNMGDYSLYRD